MLIMKSSRNKKITYTERAKFTKDKRNLVKWIITQQFKPAVQTTNFQFSEEVKQNFIRVLIRIN